MYLNRSSSVASQGSRSRSAVSMRSRRDPSADVCHTATLPTSAPVQALRGWETFQFPRRARFGHLSGAFGRLSSLLVDVWNAGFGLRAIWSGNGCPSSLDFEIFSIAGLSERRFDAARVYEPLTAPT